jgi:hypothetical protein
MDGSFFKQIITFVETGIARLGDRGRLPERNLDAVDYPGGFGGHLVLLSKG